MEAFPLICARFDEGGLPQGCFLLYPFISYSSKAEYGSSSTTSNKT